MTGSIPPGSNRTSIANCGSPDEVLPPRELQDWVGGGGADAYKAIGNEFLGYLVDLCGLHPGDTLLDVGCGSGRMAQPLTGYLSREGRYAGFDVSRPAIAWCKENISGSHPNFDFQVVDINNGMYNPTGKYEPSNFRFPYPDGSFDVVLLASVFTHMLPHDVRHYLYEIVRVLKPAGRTLSTFFLLNEESSALIKEGRGFLNFEHEMRGYRIANVDNPEAAIAYPEDFVRYMYGKTGLELQEPLRYGTWPGRTDGMSGQDVVIAVKPRADSNVTNPSQISENNLNLPRFGSSISFHESGQSEELIGPGWGLQENAYRWMTGRSSLLTLPIPPGSSTADFILMLRVRPYTANGQIAYQRCTVVCGAETAAELKLAQMPWPSWISFRLTAVTVVSEKLEILFVHPDAASPQEVGISADSRELAIAVYEVVLLPVTEADESMGWRGRTGQFVSSDWREQASVPNWKDIASKFQSMGQNCEFGLVQRRCEGEPLGLFRFAGTPQDALIPCLRSEFSELTDEQKINIKKPDIGDYISHYKSLNLVFHTHVHTDQNADLDALRLSELTRLKMLVRFFIEDLEGGEKVFVLVRRDLPLDEFEVLPVISLMRRYNPKAALLWVNVAGRDERHLVGQCEVIGNNLLKGYIDRFVEPRPEGEDWGTISLECWKDIMISSLQALGRPIPTHAHGLPPERNGLR